MKCKVLAPRGTYLPVLPVHCNKKLVFSLCMTCADGMQQTVCTHSEEERSWVGTYTTVELGKAVELGYKVVRLYEIWHYPTKVTGLFKTYIQRFLKLKQEASGWPDEDMDEDEKVSYIKEYLKREGICLDPMKIAKSPIRAVAKLALNSLWGKFGQTSDRTQVTFVSTFDELWSLLANKANVEVQSIIPVSDHVLRVTYKAAGEAKQKTCKTKNEVVAAFTTSHARLKLFNVMDQLGQYGRRKLLYCDTDSVFYVKRSGEDDPECGRFLGELVDEYPSKKITSFVTGGPKVYSYTFEDGSAVTKVKGISLNCQNSAVITPAALTKLVRTPDGATLTVVNSHKITRTLTESIVSREEKKDFRVVYTKRVIQDDFTTLPYGY